MNLELNDKVVLITGAGGAIGQAIAHSFLEEGAVVLVGYRSNPQKIMQWTSTLSEAHQSRVFPISIDLNEPLKHSETVSKIVAEHAHIDVLVNCAGAAIEKPFLILEEGEMEQQMHDNFLGHIKFTKHVLKHMFLQKSGAIVNISSILGAQFGRGVTVYASAKAAIERFSQALALEVGKKGIRVNCVCPGMIASKMTNELQRNMPPELMQMSPIQRTGTPQEVADAVLFLSSNSRASYITGTSIAVNGGLGI
jgi:NAD(P)-dependent dehydrogenase (short-subunit alcohol dehydrogenase family)